MSSLSISDKTFLEAILQMQGGYVLDFSNASFSAFFGELGIDIYDNNRYPSDYSSASKAYRMRAFWKHAPNNEVSVALNNLAEYIDAKRLGGSNSTFDNISVQQVDKLREIAGKITSDSTSMKPSNILERQTSSASLDSDKIQIKIRDEIYQHIKPYLDGEDYFHSIDEAYKVVRQKLEEITGKQKATEVFNMNAENNKYHTEIFGYTAPNGTPEGDFMRGVGYLQLAVQFLRNEKAHVLATDVDKNLALHYISLASLAYDLITRNNFE